MLTLCAPRSQFSFWSMNFVDASRALMPPPEPALRMPAALMPRT